MDVDTQLTQAQALADILVLGVKLRKAETRIMELENSLREANAKIRKQAELIGMYKACLKKRERQAHPPTKLPN